jgi:hypothetical protein
MVLETVDESDARVSKSSSRRRQHVRVIDDVKDSRLLCEMDQLPESRASRASDWCLRRTGLCSEGGRVLVREAMDGSACP